MQAVDLVEHQIELAAAIGVAEVDLGAEGAGVGAAARCLDLGAGAVRLRFEAVVVVAVPRDPRVGPAERGQGRRIARRRGRR